MFVALTGPFVARSRAALAGHGNATAEASTRGVMSDPPTLVPPPKGGRVLCDSGLRLQGGAALVQDFVIRGCVGGDAAFCVVRLSSREEVWMVGY